MLTMNKITIKNIFGHLKTILIHKYWVFYYCCKFRIPWQGITHDLSKLSPTEFWESVKYYQGGKKSPIPVIKKKNGYSEAWQHHKGRNKHHYEYWYDYAAPEVTPIIPFKYFLEMVCDSFAAGMTYQGKKWDQHYQLKYWNKVKEKSKLHPAMEKLLDRVYSEVDKQGLDKVLNKKYLKELYKEYTEDANRKK